MHRKHELTISQLLTQLISFFLLCENCSSLHTIPSLHGLDSTNIIQALQIGCTMENFIFFKFTKFRLARPLNELPNMYGLFGERCQRATRVRDLRMRELIERRLRCAPRISWKCALERVTTPMFRRHADWRSSAPLKDIGGIIQQRQSTQSP